MSADAKATRSLNAYDYNVNHRPKVAPARQIFLIRATSTVLVPDGVGSLWNCLGELQIGKEPKSAKQHTDGVHEILVEHRAHLGVEMQPKYGVRSTVPVLHKAARAHRENRISYHLHVVRLVLPPCCCSCACKSPSLTPDWALSR